MENETLEKLKYPIGKFSKPDTITKEILEKCISEIASFPLRLKSAAAHRSAEQLETPYRPGGWTIRQVIHHCADSHMNCYIRIKWALTEDQPTIKYYFEDRWSEEIDNTTMPIAPSLQLLDGLHYRLAYLMERLNAAELQKSYVHPEHNEVFKIAEVICLYAWHCNHHLAHIANLKKLKNWG